MAAACNGLKMLMTLAATITATIILVPLPTWKRIVLLVSVVPIALISNITRIVATGCCYYWIDRAELPRRGHTTVSGWLMMPLALLLVGLELAILSWLVPTEDESDDDDRKLILKQLNANTRKVIPNKKGQDPEV